MHFTHNFYPKLVAVPYPYSLPHHNDGLLCGAIISSAFTCQQIVHNSHMSATEIDMIWSLC